MSNSVLVIGNGFDLAFRLKTQYKDFVESNKWPFREKDTKHEKCLQNYLANYVETNTDELGNINWIDIEDLLLKYATNVGTSKDIDTSIVEVDKLAYQQLSNSFVEYLQEDVVPLITRDCVRVPYINDLINAIKENGTFQRVYSFNYTPTKNILKFFGYKQIRVTHLHGQIDDNKYPPILGITDKVHIPKEYCFLRKSWNETFKNHDINDALFAADECLFYGLSFGKSDFIYFERFFKHLIKNHTPGSKKKIISIFTYDEQSRQSIYSEFESAGIAISDLKSVCDFSIHKSAEYSSNNALAFDSFINYINRLKDYPKQKERTMNRLRSIV